jgi:hypothetical protein
VFYGMECKYRIVLFGASGRIGSAIDCFLTEERNVEKMSFSSGATVEIFRSCSAEQVLVLVLAVPFEVAKQIVEEVETTFASSECSLSVVVLDCSGFVKMNRPHVHGLTMLTSISKGISFVGNPGCVSGAVIEMCQILPIDKSEGLSIVATGICVVIFFFFFFVLFLLEYLGGKSFAGSGATGFRSGGRWMSHPHVKEIENALSVRVFSFVPIVFFFLFFFFFFFLFLFIFYYSRFVLI